MQMNINGTIQAEHINLMKQIILGKLSLYHDSME